jgi:hypothetical protein
MELYPRVPELQDGPLRPTMVPNAQEEEEEEEDDMEDPQLRCQGGQRHQGCQKDKSEERGHGRRRTSREADRNDSNHDCQNSHYTVPYGGSY